MPSTVTGSPSKLQQRTNVAAEAPRKTAKVDEKENDNKSERVGEAASKLDGTSRGGRHVSSQGSRPPHTPGRIALSDLVANPEDLLNQLPSATPNEQVTWKHQPGLLESPSSSVRSTQRGTKRSHSSSPTASQARKSRHLTLGDGAMDMKRVSQSLQKSPSRRSPNHDDPAAVLWSNYAEKRGNEPVLPPLPPFELSPHTPHGSAKDNSFRRTASCGNEWPTSSSKRRKLRHQDPHSTTKQIFASKRRELLKPELSKQSKVSLLLESVQQNLSARRQNQTEPSSSSPLPERYEPEVLARDQHVPAKDGSPSPKKIVHTNAKTRHGSSPLKNGHDKSSDYGDLDFDDDDLEGIENALTQGQAQLESTNHQRLIKVPGLRHANTMQPSCIGASGLAQGPRPQLEKRPPQYGSTIHDDNVKIFDEFDDDDDTFNDELQQLADKVESQTGPPVTCRSEVIQQHQDDLNNKPARTASAVNACDGAFDDDDLWDEEIDEQVLNTVHDALNSGNQVREPK